jgi:NAD(P)-dependent dehydrogenase (short-subunit alcohol dehydrogenase family)
MKLQGRRALVTGGGRGIGREVALALAREGADVGVVARTLAEVEAVATEVRGLGRKASAAAMDVASSESVRSAYRAVREALGAPDILVSAAGIAPSALLVRTTDEVWHQALETNLSGVFYAMREALPAMIEGGWGRVVNVASVAGKTGWPYVSAYVASKHGVLGLTKSAALEMATKGVTVNAVCPGYVDTPMTDSAVVRMVEKTGMSAGDARKYLEDLSPQKRLMTSAEVAALVLFLCTDDARGITGQALSVDGGTLV